MPPPPLPYAPIIPPNHSISKLTHYHPGRCHPAVTYTRGDGGTMVDPANGCSRRQFLAGGRFFTGGEARQGEHGGRTLRARLMA